MSWPEHHVHQAEAPADDERAAEERLDLLRARVGGDVEILGLDAEQQVAHRAAHHVGLESRLRAARAHTLAAAGLRRSRARPCFARGTRSMRFGGQAQHAPDEPLDHSRPADSTGAQGARCAPSRGALPRARGSRPGPPPPAASRARAAAGRCASRCSRCSRRSRPGAGPGRRASRPGARTLPSRKQGMPATRPVKRPSRCSGSVAIRCSMPNSRAIGRGDEAVGRGDDGAQVARVAGGGAPARAPPAAIIGRMRSRMNSRVPARRGPRARASASGRSAKPRNSWMSRVPALYCS